MTLSLVNIGTIANDGTGDPVRTAFGKVNTKFRGWVDVVADFGAVPDDSSASAKAANDAAFAAAHDYFGTLSALHPSLHWGGMIFIPLGDFYMGGMWEIERRVYIQGTGRGQQVNTAGSRLIFPTDSHGIRVYSELTSPGGGDGSETTIRNLCVTAVTKGTVGHGIWAEARVCIENVSAQGFGEDGIRIKANSGSTGNANKWKIDTVLALGNGGHGVFIDGNDANAGTAIAIDAKANTLWGVYDSGKFQNTHIGHHCNGNGRGSYKDENNEGCVWDGCYLELTGAYGIELSTKSIVVGGILGWIAGMENADGNYPWLSISGDGSNATAKAIVNSSGVVTAIKPLTLGSGYTSATGSVSRHGSGSGLTFTCTVSGGQVTSYTVTNGGTGYAPSNHNTVNVASQDLSTALLAASSRIGYYRANPEADVLHRMAVLGDHSKGWQWEWNESDKTYDWVHASNAFRVALKLGNDLNTSITGGSSTPIIGIPFFPNGILLGANDTSGSTPRRLHFKTSIPTSGEYVRGDIVFNVSPTFSGNSALLGWQRLVTGTNHVVGTDWKEMWTDGSIPAEVVTSTNTIGAAESGRTFYLNSATEFDSVLPAPALGLEFEFIVKAAPSGADYTISTNSSSNIIKGQVYTVDVNSATDPDFETSGGDTISFVSAKAVAGDRVVLKCDGTNWFAYCFCSVFDAITITTVS